MAKGRSAYSTYLSTFPFLWQVPAKETLLLFSVQRPWFQKGLIGLGWST